MCEPTVSKETTLQHRLASPGYPSWLSLLQPGSATRVSSTLRQAKYPSFKRY